MEIIHWNYTGFNYISNIANILQSKSYINVKSQKLVHLLLGKNSLKSAYSINWDANLFSNYKCTHP